MTRRHRHSLLYVIYLHSPLWRVRRWLWILRTGGCCQDCGHRRRPLTIHHLTYRRLGHERRSDVAVLCWSCHQARHPHHGTVSGGRQPAVGALLAVSRRRARTLCGLLLVASLILLIHLAPTLLTLIPTHR